MTPPDGQKWRGTKKPLDESERGERNSWLKAQHSENEDHGIWSHLSLKIDGETVETVTDFISGGSKITVDGDCSHEIKRCLLLGRKVMSNPDSILKSRVITLSTKVRLVKAMVFQWSYIRELDYKESWAPKNWWFGTVVLEKTLESPFHCKKIQPVHPKGNQSWILIGRTDIEAETPIFWPPDMKNWLIGKDPDPGKENEMVGWHHWLNGLESE